MSRPKPTILLEKINKGTYRSEQILKADRTYAVFYKKKPINIRSKNMLINEPYKYKKVSYQNPAHALNLASRLNEEFSTDDFEVYELTDGKKYEEGGDTE